MMDADSVKMVNFVSGQSVQVLQDIDDIVDTLALLRGEDLAPPCGQSLPSSCDCEPCLQVQNHIQAMELQVQFPLRKAEELLERFIKNQVRGESRLALTSLQSFIYACQPYFNFLESTARNKLLPFDIKRVQLLHFSQQLCDTLEHLVFTFASHNLLSLDQTEPENLSHFCVGQTQIGQLRLSTFFYCTPTPYLAEVNTGLFKRMRWNVERGDGARSSEREPETEYYFLCCQDIPNPQAESGSCVTFLRVPSTSCCFWAAKNHRAAQPLIL
ncbi:UPF0575 protein C19orf67 homolog isoform X2 [Nerophis lumbriciformis]|uniref:UPF0575 protein C19orf67 homolog isoform X2 n=1 Tax=Nerophis lumbriciformis TaxID=546530 RepID=UPI002AE09C4F|nr:UPF0575 protein C19orf67 homolog isoform X2 [Nerophis lumbriciformis]